AELSGVPAEFLTNTRSDLRGIIVLRDFDIPDACLAQRLFLDCVPRRSRTLIMAASLILDREDRPTVRIDDQDVHPLAVDRAKCLLARRCEDFPEAGLRENTVAAAR